MRLACPNCGAQYEVPPEAIPAAGRDVQCSACGHTWFEAGAAPGPDDASADGGAPRVEDDDEEADDLAEAARPDAGPSPDGAAAALAPRPPRSTVTPEVAEILRAEAEREARARGARGAHPGAHPERPRIVEGAGGAGAASAEPERERAEEARRRMARVRGEAPAGRPASAPAAEAPAAAPPAAPDAAPGSGAPPDAPREAALARRDRLPDIEEINSSLRGAPPPVPAAAPPGRPGSGPRGRFRLGFGGVLLAAAALALLYAYGARIASALPASRVVLDPYVAAVDGGRRWLDGRLQGLLRAVDGPESAPDAASGPSTSTPPATPALPAVSDPDAPPAVLPEDPALPPPGEGEAAPTLAVPATEAPAGLRPAAD